MHVKASPSQDDADEKVIVGSDDRFGLFCPCPSCLCAANGVGTGGAGGAGGTAQGGTAAGGAATNSNTLTTTGGTGGGGGQGGLGGTGGSAGGGSATATGVQTGSINSTGNNQAAEVTVNYITPVSPGGLKGLAAGVDPESGHFVNDNNVRYSGTQKIKNTPDASIGGPASGPCNGFSGGIGVSVPGFAVGANTSTVDPGCTARETARIAAMLGRMDIANAVLENTSVVQEALKARAARMAAAESHRTVAPAGLRPSRPRRCRQPTRAPIAGESRGRRGTIAGAATSGGRGAAAQGDNGQGLRHADLHRCGIARLARRLRSRRWPRKPSKKYAERIKRQEDQLKLERRLAALKAESPEQRQNSLQPNAPDVRLALASASRGSRSSSSSRGRPCCDASGGTRSALGEGATARTRSRTSGEACCARSSPSQLRHRRTSSRVTPRNARAQRRLRPRQHPCHRAIVTAAQHRRKSSSHRSPRFATSRWTS